MKNPDVYDFIAIGLGPFNLSLACLVEPIDGLEGIFLERNTSFEWHPGMLIDNTTLQNPFLADLVSLADPRSPYSFLNYCKQEGKIYSYYIRENLYLTRAEYDRYCKWAITRLSSIRFSHEVHNISYDEQSRHYVVTGTCGPRSDAFVVQSRKLVLGVGSVPTFPPCCCDPHHRYLHSADYITHRPRLLRHESITIIGSGQSAAEIFYDLLKSRGDYNYALTWITRSPRFFQLENTKLTLEMASPDYIDYFFNLPDATKNELISTQHSLYKGINARLVNQIYDLLDDCQRLENLRTHLIANCEVQACRYSAELDEYELEFEQMDYHIRYTHRTGVVLFATGYSQRIPPFISGIRERILWDQHGRYQLSRNYSVDINGDEIFVQNAGLHTHGIADPDLGMNCYRNSCIIRALTGVEHYKIEERIALQDFAVPNCEQFMRLPEHA
ncbi:lysine N(6)-hydroxylase/L-ornithine N(5)-oxygenase family protein [Pusillimonas sp. ANT_WB101]|uniref:lysine N(6)-hydroxylase/L-ornithine N(5)-oxygenase family protein n=1 Tax=Pusillimonas sp. ANT_WB101 TaxID=2597356 RepID=UPI002107ED82|nr:SidA/IucD/PvdA family monooxygenase [Pusillimonas sp. ANT_WB101]